MRKNLGAAMPCSTQQYRQQHSQPEHAESSGTNNREEAVERLKARVNELSAGRKTVKEDKIRYEDLVKQLKLDYKVNKKRSIDSLGFYLKHLDDFFKGFKAVEIRGSDVLEYVAKRQEEGAANSSINRELAALRRMFSLARQGEDLVYSPHIQQLDESDNVRQGFLNPGEFVKLHDNLPAYLKPVIEFLYLTGMRSGAARGLRHKDVDIEAKVIRLPVKLAKNKKPQLIRCPVVCWLSSKKPTRIDHSNARTCFTMRVNQLETSERLSTALLPQQV